MRKNLARAKLAFPFRGLTVELVNKIEDVGISVVVIIVVFFMVVAMVLCNAGVDVPAVVGLIDVIGTGLELLTCVVVSMPVVSAVVTTLVVLAVSVTVLIQDFNLYP